MNLKTEKIKERKTAKMKEKNLNQSEREENKQKKLGIVRNACQFRRIFQNLTLYLFEWRQ
jgi:hypothetical protein